MFLVTVGVINAGLTKVIIMLTIVGEVYNIEVETFTKCHISLVNKKYAEGAKLYKL